MAGTTAADAPECVQAVRMVVLGLACILVDARIWAAADAPVAVVLVVVVAGPVAVVTAVAATAVAATAVADIIAKSKSQLPAA
jgi:hypothetical protein